MSGLGLKLALLCKESSENVKAVSFHPHNNVTRIEKDFVSNPIGPVIFVISLLVYN